MKRLLPLLLLPVAVWATETASPWMAGHPRLLFTKAEEPAVRALAARDPLARRPTGTPRRRRSRMRLTGMGRCCGPPGDT